MPSLHYPQLWATPLSKKDGISLMRNPRRKMDKHYVSEFMVFIDAYLKEHPEVVKDQRRGWDIFWKPK